MKELALERAGHKEARWALAAVAVAACLVLVLALALAGGSASPALAKPKPPPPPPPNVLIIETDDQDQRSQSEMRNVNALIGDQGVTFSNSFVNYPLCCPSRATTLTGQYAHNHGVLDNENANGGYDVLDSTNTLPVWLQRAGYYTGLIGKYLNGYEVHRNDPAGPLIPPGYTEWQGSTRTYQFFGYELNENGVLRQYGSLGTNPDAPGGPANYSSDVYSRKAVDFINRRAPSSQPFFLWLAYLAPHSGGPNPDPPDPPSLCAGSAKPAVRHLHAYDGAQLPLPPSFNEADVSDKPDGIEDRNLFGDEDVSDINRFYRCRLASLLSMDEGIASVINALSASGELDNTLVVFTSDNGFLHGEHRVKSGKFVPYEESIRVPLLIRGPRFPANKTVRDLVTNVDVVKTIVRATKVAPGLRLDGLPLQQFGDAPARERGRELLIETDHYTGIRTRRYVYVEHFDGASAGEKELYDLDFDPYQLNNVSGNPVYGGAEFALARRLGALRGCSGAGCLRTPHLRVKLRKRSGPHGCARRPVRARIKGASRSSVVLAEFYVNGSRVGRDSQRPFLRKLPFRKLKAKKIAKAKVRATLVDGRRMTIDRSLRACR